MQEVFKEYLNSRGIKTVNGFDYGYRYKNIKLHEIISHLEAISEFHKRANGYTEYSRERIKTCTGRDIEKYKLDVRKARNMLEQTNDTEIKNDYDEFIEHSAEDNIKRAEKSIKFIFNNGYLDLIMRSMKNKEVCIGDSGLENIRKVNFIEVININCCCFNMVENDAVYFLRKIRKKKIDADFESAVSEFCKMENLNSRSADYILALLSYPHEFMKYYKRYIENKRNWNSAECCDKLKEAMLMDGQNLI